jgi:hypothetical protein
MTRLKGARIAPEPDHRRKVSMSKKIMVLALAVVSAAFVALPAMASATEIHYEPSEAFNISGVGGELRAEGEPTITCTTTSGSGKPTAGSTTTGESTLDFTGCHTAVFGFTASCKSEGAAVAGTIATSGTYHLITWNETTGVIDPTKPAVLLTTNTVKIVCAGISTIVTHGDVIGTITSPACGGSSKELKLSFQATGTTQTHELYTGKAYDLIATTGEGGAARTAALVGNATNTQSTAGKLNCT